MTVHPIDTEALRRLADAATGGPWEADHSEEDNSSIKEFGREWWDGLAFAGRQPDAEFIAAARTAVPALLDALAAAEHRATRAEAQSAIRGRAIAIYRERAREAEVWWGRWHSMWRQRGVKHLAAEKRATRAEAQSAIRGRAVAIYQERAREAEAEVKRLSWKCGHLADKYDTDTEELRQEVDQAEERIKAVLAVLGLEVGDA